MAPKEVADLIEEVARQMSWRFIDDDNCVTTIYKWLDAITEIANVLVSHCGIDKIRAVKYAVIAICSANHIQIVQIVKYSSSEHI